MKKENIKPIPKYIEQLIYKKDKNHNEIYDGKTRFYSYFTTNNKELVKITVACKNKGKKWFCKQVAIHGVNSDFALVKDIEYFYIAGYVVGWYNEGISKVRHNYEDGIWYEVEDKYYKPYAPIVNLDYVFKFDKYEYCAINKTYTDDHIKYLRLYEKYPHMELLVKFGLYNYAMSKVILNKTAKDKGFRKWLIDNRAELSINNYYVSTVVLAYTMKKPFKEVQQFEENKKYFCRNENYGRIKKYIDKNEYTDFLDYLYKNNTTLSAYQDYLTACEYLHLDMNIERNKYPRNFRKWHDIRIDQYRTKKAMDDKELRANLYKKFTNVSNKYLSLQRNQNENYIMVIAKTPNDLFVEGEILKHCVGRMNYDQKFAREESLIFFVRDKNKPDTPLVTVEYSINSKQVLQCYGFKDSRPDGNILHFVNDIWLPYANKKIRKIA